MVIPVFHEALQIGRDGGGVVHQIQMVVEDMEPVPDQFYRPWGFFDEDVSGRDLLGMCDAGIFRGDGEMAEDIPLGPFVFRLSIVEYQHAVAVPVQNVHVFPEAFPAFLGKKEGTIPANGFFPPTFPMSLLSQASRKFQGKGPIDNPSPSLYNAAH